MITRMQTWIGQRVGINTVNKVKLVGTLIEASQNGIAIRMNDVIETCIPIANISTASLINAETPTTGDN